MRASVALTVTLMLMVAGYAAAQSQENTGIQPPVRQQEIDRLKRQIDRDVRSSIEAVIDYHRETGDLNNRLDFFRYGGSLNLKLGSSAGFHLTGTRTDYMPISSAFGEHGTNLTVGLQTNLAESTEAHIEAGATRFSTDTTSINALASVTHNLSDQTRVYVTAGRSNIEESLLSAVGIRPVAGPFAGQLVGRVIENRFIAGGSSRLPIGLDLFGEGGAGNRAGSNVPSNFFKTISGGAGYSIVARPDGEPLTLLRAAYEFNYFGFNENRFGFGGASLLTRTGSPVASTRIGADRISPTPTAANPGVGGYFSPENFLGNIFRAEARGGSEDTVSYRVSAFLGTQRYTGASGRLATGLSATVSLGLTERVSLPVTYFIDNVGPFTQQSLYARLAVRF